MGDKEQKKPELVNHERFKTDLILLEAALYVAGRPLALKRLGSIIKTRSKRRVQTLARTLMMDYNNRDTAFEILELEDERFVMQLKAKYTPKVRRLAIKPLLTSGPLKTLSYVAYRQPVSQSKVIDARGSHVYGHLKQLERMGLISREKRGKTNVIRTTEFFADFFGLSHNPRTMKRQLKKVFENFTKPKT